MLPKSTREGGFCGDQLLLNSPSNMRQKKSEGKGKKKKSKRPKISPETWIVKRNGKLIFFFSKLLKTLE